MHSETLWNGYTLLQSDHRFRLSTDSMVCAAFSHFPKNSRVADLGCGSGAISLLLLASDPTLTVTGIELDETSAALASQNAKQCSGALSVLQGDLRQIRQLLPPGSMDCCISNPPYFPAGSGKQADGPLGRARSEETLSLSQLAEAAAWLLKTGGRFVLVHRPERLADLIWDLRTAKLEPKRIRFVRHQPQSSVNLVLIEARKGGRPGLAYEADLILLDKDGAETDEYKAIYHRINTP